MSFCSPPFLLFICVVSVGFLLCPTTRARKVFLSLANVGFLSTFIPNLGSWLFVALFIGGTFVTLQLEKARRSRSLVGSVIGLVVVLYLWVKQYTVALSGSPPDWALRAVEVIGLSYMLFRFIHVIVDQSQGQLAPRSWLSYANYQLAFFTLAAGPIQRYNDFQQPWNGAERPVIDRRVSLVAWSRILTGMLKMGVAAPAVWYIVQHPGLLVGDASPTPAALPAFAANFYLYPVYLYFNFSGYTDIAIGSAQLIGFPLPENFNRPFLARNPVDFWSRWHISLTRWIRDYVFMMSYKALVTRYPSRGQWLGYGLLFVSLFVAGIWHGATAGFAVFGAIHGLGVAITQLYGDWLKARLSRIDFRRYQKNAWIRFAATFATLHFVCFSFLFFSLDVDGTLALLRNLRGSPATTTFASRFGEATLVLGLLVPLLLLAFWKRETLQRWSDRVTERLTQRDEANRWVVISKVAVVILMFLATWAFGTDDPVVVYQRF